MRRLPVQQADAFTTTQFHGNPAGVVLDASGLSDKDMQHVARELNCSETAFVLPSSKADLRLRYFSPTTEVDLCGHATIATLCTMHQTGMFSGGVQVETNAGALAMEVDEDATAWMEQAQPAFRDLPADEARVVADLLGLNPQDIDGDIPLALAYTGLWDLLVPLRHLESLRRAKPNFAALADHNRTLRVTSTHLFCFETEEAASTLHARDFSPAAGIPEDPHTGTASGALGAYLVRRGRLQPGNFTFEQGWSVGRPGHIQVQVAPGGAKVRVGGRAATVMRGEMLLP